MRTDVHIHYSVLVNMYVYIYDRVHGRNLLTQQCNVRRGSKSGNLCLGGIQ